MHFVDEISIYRVQDIGGVHACEWKLTLECDFHGNAMGMGIAIAYGL